MKHYIPILLICLVGQVCFAQEIIENRTVLNRYENGQTMREHVTYLSNDTLVEITYYENGQIREKGQITNNQKNGWSYIYDENGELIFRQTYLNNKLTDELKCFYPSRKISRIEHYWKNQHIDTTTYFDEDGQIIRTIEFLSPCEFGSRECSQFVTIFENGDKVYGYKVDKGMKSGNDEIYNQEIYDKMMTMEKQLPLQEVGRMIFQNNCGMCHTLEKPLVGPALSCITKTTSTKELRRTIIGENGHPPSKLTEEEINALIEYLNKTCP